MINNIKSDIEKRTGLPSNVVDQVLNALGQVVSERYPQYAGMIGPILGIPTTQSGASGTSGGGTPSGSKGSTGQGELGTLMGDVEGMFGGQGQGQQGSNTQTKA